VRRIAVQSQPRQIVCETLSQKTQSPNIGLAEWLKVKALNSSPSNAKRKKEGRKEGNVSFY
jgi:hypothetical protein